MREDMNQSKFCAVLSKDEFEIQKDKIYKWVPISEIVGAFFLVTWLIYYANTIGS